MPQSQQPIATLPTPNSMQAPLFSNASLQQHIPVQTESFLSLPSTPFNDDQFVQSSQQSIYNIPQVTATEDSLLIASLMQQVNELRSSLHLLLSSHTIASSLETSMSAVQTEKLDNLSDKPQNLEKCTTVTTDKLNATIYVSRNIRTNKGGRKKEQLQFKTLREYTREFITAIKLVCAGISNVPFHDYLKCFLAHTREGQALLKDTIDRLNKSVKGGKRSVFQWLGLSMPNKDGHILIQDITKVSDANCNIINTLSGLPVFHHSSTLCRQRVSYWRPECINKLGMQCKNEITTLDVHKVLQHVLQQEYQSIKEITSDTKEFKLSYDSNKTRVALLLSSINMTSRCAQDPEDAIPLALWPKSQGESLVILQQNANHVLQQLKQLIANPIVTVQMPDGREIKVTIILRHTSDLFAIWIVNSISKPQFCPFCKVLNTENRTKTCTARTMKDVFGIQPTNTCICALHALSRIVSQVLQLSLCKYPELLRKLQSLPTLHGFELHDAHWNDDCDLIIEKMPMMSKLQCITILANIIPMLVTINAHHRLKSLWESTINVCYLYLLTTEDEVMQCSATVRGKWLQQWIEDWCSYEKEPFYYMHILYCHGEWLLMQFKSLARYANEGVENVHQFYNMLLMRDSNRGGGLNPVATTQQIVERCGRLILLVNELSTTLHEGNQQLYLRYCKMRIAKQQKMQRLGVLRRCKIKEKLSKYLNATQISTIVQEETQNMNNTAPNMTTSDLSLLDEFNAFVDDNENEIATQVTAMEEDDEFEKHVQFVTSAEFDLLNNTE